MAHRIDVEHDQDGGQGAVVGLRRGTSTPAFRARPSVHAVPSRAAQGDSRVSRKRIWDKDNVGFWLTVCILISLAFSIVWRAIG